MQPDHVALPRRRQRQGSRLPAAAAAFIALLLAACGKPSGSDADKPAAQATVAAAGKPLSLSNPGFEAAAIPEGIAGWQFVQHAGPQSYAPELDTRSPFAGKASFRVTRTAVQFYGSLIQDLKATGLGGRRVELSAALRCKDVGKRGWKLFLNANVRASLAYSPGCTGTTDWQRDTVTLQLPANTKRLTVGATLLDAGTGWVDDVTVRLLDR